MGKIYMIGSQKGGTAKTTTTFNLAYCLRLSMVAERKVRF